MKEMLWVVVGAGYPDSFDRAIKSVLSETRDDILAIYNRVSAGDSPLSVDQSAQGMAGRVQIRVHNNEGHPKVGALYAAYNHGIRHAVGSYRFISFIQGDMQVMRWPSNMSNVLDEIFDSESPKVFAVTSTFPSRGAFDSFKTEPAKTTEAKNFAAGMAYTVVSHQPVSDVAVYSLELITKLDFIFERNEGYSSQLILKKGYVAASLHPPNLASVPWPGSVRNGKRKGTNPRVEGPFLELKNLSGAMGEKDSPVRWQEESVLPRGYRTLYPYWPTDLVRAKWIYRRGVVTRRMGISFWQSVDNTGKMSSFLLPSRVPRHPRLVYVLFRLVWGLSVDAINQLTRHLRYGWKLIVQQASARRKRK